VAHLDNTVELQGFTALRQPCRGNAHRHETTPTVHPHRSTEEQYDTDQQPGYGVRTGGGIQIQQEAHHCETGPPQQRSGSRARLLVVHLLIDRVLHGNDFGTRGKWAATLGRYSNTTATTETRQARTVTAFGNNPN